MAELAPSKTLQAARTIIQVHLSQISSLDSRLHSIMHKNLLKQQPYALNSIGLESYQLQSLSNEAKDQKTWELVQKLSEQKVQLANQLYRFISEACTTIQGLMSPSQLQKSKSKDERSQQHSRLIAQCLSIEASNFCICNQRERRKISPDELMVACEANRCKKRWFHLQCLGLRLEELPEVFICKLCSSLQQ